MNAEYNHWYECREGQMPEDFANMESLCPNRLKLVVVQINKDNDDFGLDCQHREILNDRYKWQDYRDDEVLAWFLPFGYYLQKAEESMFDRVCTDPKQARKELEEIAKRMNLPITDDRVALAWSDNGNIHNSFSKEVYNEVIFPLYYQKNNEKHGC